jgi:Tol biopolymer transport system component
MTFRPGTWLGPYEIVGPLGAGGMGEVYRARDSRLKREVALKALPDEFSKDVDRLSRFQREAEVLASLSHPHIAAIYGLEEAEGSRFLILELVEGETLADRLARGAMPVEEALTTARQVSEALEAAHGRGIVHRDLKPANIKLTPDGVAKVLDFGLAKVTATEAEGVGDSNVATLMSSAPAAFIGTPAYMSPEQVSGKQTDRASDVWAFGCVLFEMLTGSTAFPGESVGEIVGAVCRAEPDWLKLPADTPQGIRRLLRRCLRKDRKHRLHDIADARIEIDEARDAALGDGGQPLLASSKRKERMAWLALVALVSGAAAGIAFLAFRSRPAATEMHLEINTPAAVNPLSFAIAPDGQKIIFTARLEGRPVLWLRSLESNSTRPLSQTRDASAPFWSPDSRSVGFFADGKLKRMDLDGESVRVIATATADVGGTWNRAGQILFSPTPSSPIFRVSDRGGEATPVTRLQPGHGSHRTPQFLGDGRHFVFYVVGEPPGLYVGRLDDQDDQDLHRLIDAEAGVYAPTGQLLFVRQRKMYVQTIDAASRQMVGNASEVDGPVFSDNGQTPISASATGSLLYRTGPVVGQRQLVWFDRSGAERGRIGEPDAENPLSPSMSPNGRYVALQRTVNGNQDLWLLETARGVLNRLTSDPALDSFPVWSPDGRSIVFNSTRKGVYDIYRKAIDGSGGEDLVLATLLPKGPSDWSPDGRLLLFRSPDPKTGFDIWAVTLEGERKPFPVVRTNFDERDGQFSPDGRWIAYESNESGQYEIYIQPFPGPGGKIRVSRNGGAQIRWRRDGKELFYIGLDARLMAVPIQIRNQTLETGDPVPLFSTHIGGALQARFRQQYMVSDDGQRFLMNNIEEEPISTMKLIVNWTPKPPG